MVFLNYGTLLSMQCIAEMDHPVTF